MRQYIFGLAALVVLTGAIFGASAFTSAEVVRDSSVNVASDSNGIITLAPGATSAVTTDSNGELTIDTSGNADGLNVGANFTFGDNASPTTDPAFSMTNADSETRSFTVAYDNVADNEGVNDAIEFIVYDGSGSEVATVDSANDATISAGAGSTYHVVIQVNTDGLSSGADLSGDLVITA